MGGLPDLIDGLCNYGPRVDTWRKLIHENALLPMLAEVVRDHTRGQSTQLLADFWRDLQSKSDSLRQEPRLQHFDLPCQMEIVRVLIACAKIAAIALRGELSSQLPQLLQEIDPKAETPDELACQAASLREEWWRFLRQWLESLKWPEPFTSSAGWDIVTGLAGRPRPVGGATSVAILLVAGRMGGEEEGVVGELWLEELTDGGRGVLYPDPGRMVFIGRDTAFREAERNAADFARQVGSWGQGSGPDVRWWITSRDGKPLDSIGGGSLGGAFGLGLAKLRADSSEVPGGRSRRPSGAGAMEARLLERLNLSGVAITAQIRPDGSLCEVDAAFKKLLAAAREGSLPRIHTVVVAEDQRDDVELIDAKLLEDDPNAEFRVISVRSVAEAVSCLVVSGEARWGAIVDCTSEFSRHREFVGRSWLKDQVRGFIESHDRGYLLVVGGPGVGKSALIANLIRSADKQPIYHFIKRGMGNWDEPETVLASLTAQLRRKYALPRSIDEKSVSASVAFIRALQAASGPPR